MREWHEDLIGVALAISLAAACGGISGARSASKAISDAEAVAPLTHRTHRWTHADGQFERVQMLATPARFPFDVAVPAVTTGPVGGIYSSDTIYQAGACLRVLVAVIDGNGVVSDPSNAVHTPECGGVVPAIEVPTPPQTVELSVGMGLIGFTVWHRRRERNRIRV